MYKAKTVLLVLFVVIMLLCLSGCFNYSEAAGYYEDDFGNWLHLEYDKPSKGTYNGTLFLEGIEYEIFWKYDLEKDMMVITIWRPLGNSAEGQFEFEFLYLDIFAYYEEGVITLECPAGWYTLYKLGNSALAFEQQSITPPPTIAPNWMSKELAQGEGGLYIQLEDGCYWPLQCAEKTSSGYDSDANFVMTSIYTEEIPVLGELDKLVIFSENEIDEIVVFPVQKDGYTVPLNFESYPNYYYEEQSVSVFDFEGGLFIVDEALDTQARALYAVGFPMGERCAIEIENNGYDNFYNDCVIDSHTYCSMPTESAFGDGCWSRGVMFADMEKEDDVTISFYQGTQYVEHTMTADLHYFAYDGCLKDEGYSGDYPDITLTKEGYAEIDTSTLSNGYYVLQQSGFVMQYYVFKVE